MSDDPRQILIYFLATLLGLAAIFTILGIILNLSSKHYLRKHRTKIREHNPELFRTIADSSEYLIAKKDYFENCVRELGFNRLIDCSSSIVSSSSQNPIKYLQKYSNIEYTLECMELLDYTENYLTKYYNNIRNTKKAWQECKHIIPLIHRLAIKQQKAINTICEVNYNANSIKTPYLIFRYTSPAGKSTRSHRIIIDEDIIAELRSDISQKLSKSGHAKEQRKAMTADLREAIKKRDNYTCQICGNSVLKEPNLLLEVDHIVPVSKGGKTEASNLQTLCWRCNRAKSDKE